MEVDFYDKTGSPVAYALSGDMTIYLFSGEPVGYITDNAIYAFSGRQLGWFEDGWVRDLSGKCVFSTVGAKGGPITQPKHLMPVKGIRRTAPIKHVKQLKSVKPIKSAVWSSLSGRQFFL